MSSKRQGRSRGQARSKRSKRQAPRFKGRPQKGSLGAEWDSDSIDDDLVQDYMKHASDMDESDVLECVASLMKNVELTTPSHATVAPSQHTAAAERSSPIAFVRGPSLHDDVQLYASYSSAPCAPVGAVEADLSTVKELTELTKLAERVSRLGQLLQLQCRSAHRRAQQTAPQALINTSRELSSLSLRVERDVRAYVTKIAAMEGNGASSVSQKSADEMKAPAESKQGNSQSLSAASTSVRMSGVQSAKSIKKCHKVRRTASADSIVAGTMTASGKVDGVSGLHNQMFSSDGGGTSMVGLNPSGKELELLNGKVRDRRASDGALQHALCTSLSTRSDSADGDDDDDDADGDSAALDDEEDDESDPNDAATSEGKKPFAAVHSARGRLRASPRTTALHTHGKTKPRSNSLGRASRASVVSVTLQAQRAVTSLAMDSTLPLSQLLHPTVFPDGPTTVWTSVKQLSGQPRHKQQQTSNSKRSTKGTTRSASDTVSSATSSVLSGTPNPAQHMHDMATELDVETSRQLHVKPRSCSTSSGLASKHSYSTELVEPAADTTVSSRFRQSVSSKVSPEHRFRVIPSKSDHEVSACTAFDDIGMETDNDVTRAAVASTSRSISSVHKGHERSASCLLTQSSSVIDDGGDGSANGSDADESEGWESDGTLLKAARAQAQQKSRRAGFYVKGSIVSAPDSSFTRKKKSTKRSHISHRAFDTFENVLGAFHQFLSDTAYSTAKFPPLTGHDRKRIHSMADLFEMKSETIGSGKAKSVVLHRTVTSHAPHQVELKVAKAQWQGAQGTCEVTPITTPHYGRQAVDTSGVVGAHASPLGHSNVGSRMLRSLGWQPGTGLGLYRDGITEPVMVLQRPRRMGLGTMWSDDIVSATDGDSRLQAKTKAKHK
eukprot:m.304519 g.304519  ORF g.304519 m.304519 type:complete len:894 (-) comp15901_c0_seq2:332-3013(-)